MIFTFGHYKIDIDLEKTKAFYDSEVIEHPCTCISCRNFQKAIAYLPSDIKNFFGNLGIDIRKEAEVSSSHTKENGRILYSGFYHLCGTILDSGTEEQHFKFFKILDGFAICFQSKCDLLEKDFPMPAIQLEFALDVPWVLSEENPF